MAYTLSPAKDAMKIAEQEYGSAAEIKFTAFTSCIGVIVRAGDTLHAVHLVMTSSDDSIFDTAAAATVLGVLPKKYDEAYVIGGINLWQNKRNNVLAGFEKLISGLDTVTKAQQYTFAQGTYGAGIDAGKIDITY